MDATTTGLCLSGLFGLLDVPEFGVVVVVLLLCIDCVVKENQIIVAPLGSLNLKQRS